MDKKYKRIAAIGHFAFGKNLLNGQTVKTVTVTNALEKVYGSDEMIKMDTGGGAKAILKLPFQVHTALKRAGNIVIFPAQRGLKIIVPLLAFLNRFYHKKLHYCVIGGWLPEMLKQRKGLIRGLKSFDGIYVETNTMKSMLETMGFTNIFLTPNCKELRIVDEHDLIYPDCEPYRLCTFSRVMKEKGIEEAVEAVVDINRRYQRNVYTLDIYGPVDAAQTEWFEGLKASFSDAVQYKGSVPFEQSVDVLKSYYALLFPTRFYTEGVPGTIIDAYAAGVPVIAARWESFSDIISDRETGVGYDFDSYDGLKDALSYCYEHRAFMISMKKNCLKKARDYIPENALTELIRHLGV